MPSEALPHVGDPFPDDESVMRRALEIAQAGVGKVEPNPAVGAVIVDAQRRMIAEGFHPQFGGPHAEVVALRAAGAAARGATIFVTLEPCSHHGKTPPCADALIDAGIKRVVVAVQDPAEHVAGQGIARLQQAGIAVEVGLCAAQARQLIAPFEKLMVSRCPFVHAKWAMTLDGKIASRIRSSKWISNETSRAVVHQLRGRMDAIITGIGTVLSDDPQLTVRPPGDRVPVRVVLDTRARLPLTSQLVQTSRQVPVLLFAGDNADPGRRRALIDAGIEVVSVGQNSEGKLLLGEVLSELGQRQMTNVLLEAGGELLGAFLDDGHVDEVHCFIAPKLIGGRAALMPFGGHGLDEMGQARKIDAPIVEVLDGDVYIRGRMSKPEQGG